MTTVAVPTQSTQHPDAPRAGATGPVPTPRPRRDVRPVPLSRTTLVELRKMFDTRSGFWLLASVGITATLATAAVVLFAPDEELTYETFAGAIGFPMTVILPVIAILSVTSEWSQRSGLTTFSLVPHRGTVIGAKAIGVVAVGIASMLVAMAVGAVGNLAGTAITGTPTVWNMSVPVLLDIVLANVLGMLIGFMLGLLIRGSAGAVVAYFVYSFVLTGLSMVLAANQQWWADLQPWLDFNYAQGALFNGPMSGEQWANLATSSILWLVIPLAVGLALVRRSEVK